jgi:hypothetical protein
MERYFTPLGPLGISLPNLELSFAVSKWICFHCYFGNDSSNFLVGLSSSSGVLRMHHNPHCVEPSRKGHKFAHPSQTVGRSLRSQRVAGMVRVKFDEVLGLFCLFVLLGLVVFKGIHDSYFREVIQPCWFGVLCFWTTGRR